MTLRLPHANQVVNVVALITLAGLVLRVICCFHGWPQHLHVDEPTVVRSAIDMLSRHSWEAHSFNRPDLLEIKLDSLLFTIFSHLRYGMPAHEAFASHESSFYVVARLLTATLGTAAIPVSALLCAKMSSKLDGMGPVVAPVVGASLAAFPSVLVEHSSYATPDVVLAFLTLVFCLCLARYAERGGRWQAAVCAAIIGLAVTVKYPSAILSAPFAAAVIWRKCAVERRPVDVIPFAAVSVGIVLAVVFIVAPNLLTNIQAVLDTIRFEASTTHLGADELGFVGNT